MIDGQLQNIACDRWQEGGMANKVYRLSSQNNQIIFLTFLANDPDEIQKLLAQRASNTKSAEAVGIG